MLDHLFTPIHGETEEAAELRAGLLDALFDQFLISFDATGAILISEAIDSGTQTLLGISPTMRLRWVAEAHRPYLAHHRERAFG